jgi:hypothetical protein
MCVILPVKMNIKVNYSFGNVLSSHRFVCFFFSHETNKFKGTVHRTPIGLELLLLNENLEISNRTTNSKMNFKPCLLF